jgi:hypothetical protein
LVVLATGIYFILCERNVPRPRMSIYILANVCQWFVDGKDIHKPQGAQNLLRARSLPLLCLIKTASATQDVVLRFQWACTNIGSLGQMDWSFLRIRSNFHGVWGFSISHESILDALEENEALMG